MRITVQINGTDQNPYEKWGFTANPFPAIPDASPRYVEANRILRLLAAGPVTSADHLKQILTGCSQEFIDLCAARYQRGQIVTFVITWPGD